MYHDNPLRTFNIGQTAMLTLHTIPEVGGTQSVSYGGVGMNASEGMRHNDTVINVETLRESGIDLEVELMINSLRSTSQELLYFDDRALQIAHSVDSRMNEVGTRGPGANSINGLEVGADHGQSELDQSEFGDSGLKAVRCTQYCSVEIGTDGKQISVRHVDECMNITRIGCTMSSERPSRTAVSGKWNCQRQVTQRQQRELPRLHALQTALTDMGENDTCPSRVRVDKLLETTKKHLKHIYAELRGDAEGCTRLKDRGPKCDILFDSKRDTGTTGLICACKGEHNG